MEPWCGGLEGVFGRLLGESAETPLLGLCGLERLQFLEEAPLEGTNAGV